ncbi:MAG: HAMP domain-containing protein [Calditerrivibrio sp.]|nr:HAMP domain-containing protein [Calditerrivibrio sp.]MCA1932320.1 HAMP domain-containing protein [Calditerrivibrio sp.]MCA1980812.1 HAMP domain-containing protein [Calditerrivibrio sp.]
MKSVYSAKRIISYLFLLVMLLFANIVVSNHIVNSNFPWYSNIAIFVIININFVLLLILVVVIFRNVGKLFLERKSSVYGAKLKTKLVVFSALLSILPVLIVFVLSNSIINKSIDKWFDLQIEQSLKSSVELYKEYQQQIESEVVQQTKVLSQLIVSKGYIYNENFMAFKEFVNELISSKKADGVLVFNALKIVIVNDDNNNNKLFNSLSDDEINKTISDGQFKKSILTDQEQVYIAGESLISNNNKVGAIFIYKNIPYNQLSKASKILESYKNYKQLKVFSQPIKYSYKILLFSMTLLVSFAGIWGSIVYARNITNPLDKLLTAYREVETGNLNINVEKVGDDEIALLIESFNHMVDKLRSHTDELSSKNKVLSDMFLQISKDNQYIDIIFKNVGAAIFLFDNRLKALKINHAARIFIDESNKLNDKISIHIRDFVRSNFNDKTIQVDISIKNEIRTYSVGMTKLFDTESGVLDNVIVVIDDITDVVYVQRVNIWRDIATRMAHEIKNPLTPIKLNAERIYKKCRDMSDEKLRDIISEGMMVIINEVSELQKLVGEFNDFARLPALKREVFDLCELVEGVVGTFRGPNPDITFNVICSNELKVSADRNQIRRVFMNLISNAIHAMNSSGTLTIEVKDYESYYEISVLDTGHGIPEEDIGKIFLPYYSKKSDGTGLGLAIVKKIIDEHSGKVYAKSKLGEYTQIFIELPKGMENESIDN